MTSARHGVLVIEASSARGSLALIHAGRVEATRSVPMGAGRDDALFPAISDLLGGGTGAPLMPEAIVCGSGPGSFTSLRIAASLAKGLAHGAGIPVRAVPSLLLAAAAVPMEGPDEFIVHADALRTERFALAVRRGGDGSVEALGPVRRVSMEWVRDRVPPAERVAVGGEPEGLPGWCCVTPEAAALVRVVPAAYQVPVELAEWEPAYGRLAEAQVQWEATHGQSLPLTGPTFA
jgi:tRNA threonylcarbamoyladenosine biosynthesis protein TsaB